MRKTTLLKMYQVETKLNAFPAPKRRKTKLGALDISPKTWTKGELLGRGSFGSVYQGSCSKQRLTCLKLKMDSFSLPRKFHCLIKEVRGGAVFLNFNRRLNFSVGLNTRT
ncbi:hypothetical protein ABKV19_018636 [Rosa sericea]